MKRKSEVHIPPDGRDIQEFTIDEGSQQSGLGSQQCRTSTQASSFMHVKNILKPWPTWPTLPCFDSSFTRIKKQNYGMLDCR